LNLNRIPTCKQIDPSLVTHATPLGWLKTNTCCDNILCNNSDNTWCVVYCICSYHSFVYIVKFYLNITDYSIKS